MKKKMRIVRRWDAYTLPSSFLSLRIAVVLVAVDLVIGVGGYTIMEGYTLVEAFYMAIITISTVGYTEVSPLDTPGKLFTSFYIIINLGLIAYILAVFSYYVVQGEIFKKMHNNLIDKTIGELSAHIVLCGYGKYGKEIVANLSRHHIPYVIIDVNEAEIEAIRKSEEKLLYVHGDATHDETLEKAGIKRAQALISALPDDASNVFTVLTARQLNKNMSIVSRAMDAKSERKLRLAGANHVVMPEQIGGFYMATLISKPGAVEFFTFITRNSESDIFFEEIPYESLPENLRELTIRDINLRKETGVNIIGYKHPDGHFEVNPDPDTKMMPDSSFIIIGNRQQNAAMRKFLDKSK